MIAEYNNVRFYGQPKINLSKGYIFYVNMPYDILYVN